MTTFERIAEQVLRLLGKRTDDSDIKWQEVTLRAKQTFAWLIRQRFFQSKADDVAEVPGGAIYTFRNVSVQEDADFGYYVTLPATTMDLMYGQGVRTISPMKEPSTNYTQVPNGFNNMYAGLASKPLNGMVGWYVENDRAYFVNMEYINKPDSVIVRIVAPLDGIEDNDNINVPSDMQQEIIALLVQEFGQAGASDDTNNAQDQV